MFSCHYTEEVPRDITAERVVITHTVFTFGDGATGFISCGAARRRRCGSTLTFTERLAALLGDIRTFFGPGFGAAFRGDVAYTTLAAKITTTGIVVGFAA